MSGVILIVSVSGMVAAWPMEVEVERFLLPFLFFGSLVSGSIFAYWLLVPRNMFFSIERNQVLSAVPHFRYSARI